MAKRESSLLSGLNTGHPNVIIVDEAYEAGVPRADLGVHTCA